MIQLRQYQAANYADIQTAWKTQQNVLYVAPCRSGKTVVMSKAIADNKSPSLVLAHRGELIVQLSMTLARLGIQHKIIGPATLAKACSQNHVQEFGKNFISTHARCYLASAQTLMRSDPEPWMAEVRLWIADESHHYVEGVAWTKVLDHFPNARGLGVTATPTRADGKGMGRHADGLFDTMILGPSSRELIRMKYLTEYRIYAPPNDIDLSSVTISASGDYSPTKLAAAVHKSHITGDIVQQYLRVTPGALGMTFATNIKSSTEIASAFRAAGVPAECVSGKTPDALRREIQHKHQRGELKQIVSVDLYGEGIDIPNLEVVSFGRPTASLGLYIQQFWRPGNPRSDKPHFTVLDHVGNVLRHGLPDAKRQWSLDRRERRARSTPDDVIQIKVCGKCLAVYERIHKICPYCGEAHIPTDRSTPEAVDGDLAEMSPELLARLRGEIDKPLVIPHNASPAVVASIKKLHSERQDAQRLLRGLMAHWTMRGDDVNMQQRLFYIQFGCDVLSAMALNKADSIVLGAKIMRALREANVEFTLDTGG